MIRRLLHCVSRLALLSAAALLSLTSQVGGILFAQSNAPLPDAGTLRICGSPQMSRLLHLYESAFATVHPGVRFENHLKSTLDAVPCIAGDRAELGLLGREIWPSEVERFAAVRGHAPLSLRIAIGSYDVPKATFALMVFVPRANPLAALSLPQLARIFSSDHPVRIWADLGCKGSFGQRPIHLYGFDTSNDKARIFRTIVFRRGASWNPALIQFRNRNGIDAGRLILDAVAQDPDAIGISNIHYATSQVRALSLAPALSDKPVAPTRRAVASGAYPLVRTVSMVVDRATLRNALIVEFLRYVLSAEGQDAVAHEGNYLPLTPAMIRREQVALAASLR